MSGCFANQARGIIGTLAGVTLSIYCFYADAAASLSEVGRSLSTKRRSPFPEYPPAGSWRTSSMSRTLPT
jgi:hypothetical protein